MTAKAISSPDGTIALIPTSSYSFHHSDAKGTEVTCLSSDKVVVSVCTIWKPCTAKAIFGHDGPIASIPTRPTPFITLMPRQVRSPSCLSCEEVVVSVYCTCTIWKRQPKLFPAMMGRLLRFQRRPTSFITLMPRQAKSRACHERKWSFRHIRRSAGRQHPLSCRSVLGDPQALAPEDHSGLYSGFSIGKEC